MRTQPIVVTALVLSLAGCHPARDPLEPAPGQQAASEPGDAIEQTVAGVEVVAASQAWEGSRDVLEHVTPIRVTVRNSSGHPVRIHLSDMHLVDQSGKSYAALPLYLINGSAEVERHAFTPSPAFAYERYYVDGPYGPYYPNITVYEYVSPYDYSVYDYGGYYTYWESVPLPTQYMVDHAIPEGVIDDGGYVSGFVYFQRVDPKDSEKATFELDLMNAKSGERMGQVDLVFEVIPPSPR